MVQERLDLDLDASDDDAGEEYRQMREMLHEHISEFSDEHDLPFGALAMLLIDLGLSSRMLHYATSVEKPSEFGFKRDLDRFERAIGEFVRNAKRHAGEFISHARELREPVDDVAAAEDELDDEAGRADRERATAGKP